MKIHLVLLAVCFCTYTTFSQTITPSGPVTFCNGQTVNLMAPAADSWQWQLNSSNIAVAANAQIYIATLSGSYTVIFTIAGVPDTTDAITVTVNPNPVPSFIATNNFCSGTSIPFTGSATNGTAPYTFAWSFQGGGTATGTTPSHIHSSLGCGNFDFHDTLRVTDANGCKGQVINPVTIRQAPDVQLSDPDFFTPFSNCDMSPTPANPNFTLTVNNSTPSAACISSYTLNWGDGFIETGLTNASFPRAHEYTQLGAFDLTITALSNNNCTYSKVYPVANQVNPSVSLGTFGPLSGCDSLRVGIVIGLWMPNSPGTTYLLEFGDGTSVTFNHPINAQFTNDTVYHTYTTTSCPDSLGFKPTVTAKNYCRNTPIIGPPIQVWKKPQPNFSYSPNPGCTNQAVQFINQTITGYYDNCSTITIYNWNFGDPASGAANTYSGPNPPAHIYSTAGTYTVTLSSQNGCGTTTMSKTVCISAAPVASFTTNVAAVCTSGVVNVTNTSINSTCGTTNYLWSVTYTAGFCGTTATWAFANGSNNTSANPSFTFSTPGTYTITLTINHPCGNSTAQKVIKVKQPPTVSLAAIADACNQYLYCPAPVIVNCGETALTYAWLFDGVPMGNAQSANPGCISFTTTGIHTVSLAVTNECGTTTVNRQFTINSTANLTVPASAQYCPAEATGNFIFSSTTPGAVITWTNNNTTIGLAASGNGSVNSFTTINNGTVPVVATINVTAAANGCSGTGTFTITVHPKPAAPVASSPVNYCLNDAALPLTATALPGHTLLWYAGASGGSGSSTAPLPLTTTQGTFTFYVSQINTTTHCESSRSMIAVNVRPVPSIGASSFTSPAACATATGTITLTGLNSSVTYQVQYTFNGNPLTVSLTSNVSGTIILSNLISGIYANIKVNLNGCVSNEAGPFTLTDPNPPATPVAGSNAPLCAGQSLNLTANSATPGVTYTWTGPNGFASTQQNPVINPVTVAANGTYHVTATLNNCQSVPADVTVLIYPRPSTPVVGNAITVCSGDAINLQSSTNFPGPVIYAWTGPNGFSSDQQNPVITNAAVGMSGNYSLTITATTGDCASPVANVTVTVNARPVISGSNAANPSACGTATGSVILNGLTAFTSYVVHYTKNGIPVTVTITANVSAAVVINNLTAGVYDNFNMTLLGCLSNTVGPFTLSDPNPPPAPVAGSNSPICQGASLQFTATSVAGTSFAWTGPNSFTSNLQNPVIPSVPVAASGVYHVTAILNNCQSAPVDVDVLIHPRPATPVVTTPITICSDDAINLQSSTNFPGPVTYAWSGPNGFTSDLQNPVITNAVTSMSGIYSIVVTSTTGNCASPAGNVNVTVNPRPFISGNMFTHPTACGSATGSITLNGLTPNASYIVHYLKNAIPVTVTIVANASGNAVINNLTAGIYSAINVTLLGCLSNSVGPLTLTDPNPPPAPVAGSNSPICQGEALQLTANSSAGSTYAWSGPNGFTSTTQHPVINPATLAANGTYTVRATLANCQSLPASIDVLIHPRPSAPTVPANLAVCAGDTIKLQSSSNFAGTLTYAWTGPNGFTSNLQHPTIPHATAAMAGSYTLVITSVTGSCASTSAATTVTIVPLPNISSSSHINPIGCGTATGSIILNGLIPNQNYIVQYTKNGIVINVTVLANNAGSVIIGGLTNGIYTDVTVSRTGCPSNSVGPFMLKDTAPFSVLAESNAPLCEFNNLLLGTEVTTTGGATYVWTGPNGFTSNIQSPVISNATVLNNGIYYVSVTIDGCTVNDSIAVTVSEHSIGGVTGPDATVCRGKNDGTINLSGNLGQVIRWEASINNGVSWGPVDNTSFFLVYHNQTIPTWYRAVIKNGDCPFVYSTVTKINVINSVESVSFTPDAFGTCVHDTTIVFTATPVYTGTDPVSYYWYINGQIRSTVNPFSLHLNVPLSSTTDNITTIRVLAENSSGCGDTSATATIVIKPLPVIHIAKRNDITCSLGVSQLTVTGAAHYTWWAADSTLRNASSAIIDVTPAVTTTYHVLAEAANGCQKEDSIPVIVNKTPANGYFDMPNAFTPNGDGLNDCLGVQSWGQLDKTTFEFSIFNRWGRLLFHTTNPAECWDGTWNGKEQADAVYVYWIKAKTICEGKKFWKGTVVLVR